MEVCHGPIRALCLASNSNAVSMLVYRNLSMQPRLLHRKRNPVIIFIDKIDLALDAQLFNDRARGQEIRCIVGDLVKLCRYLNCRRHRTQQVDRFGMIKYQDTYTKNENEWTNKQAQIQMQ